MQQAQIGGCTQAFATSSAEASAATPGGNVRSCLPQAFIDSGIEGYTEQINKTFPADWSKEMIDNYKAEMQKGIDTLKGTCVSKYAFNKLGGGSKGSPPNSFMRK